MGRSYYHKKTILISRLVAVANAGLANSDTVDRQWRLGIISFIEAILNETNNYKGYKYLDSEYIINSKGEKDLKEKFDYTRRRYI